MKKTLFAALALVAMASCSNEEVLEMAQKEAIAFNNAFVNNATRSVVDPSITSKTIKDFAVYGFVKANETSEAALFFNGVLVNKDIVNNDLDANNPWNYSGTQYWIKDAKYNFAAVSPVEGKEWNLVGNPSVTGMTLTFTNTGSQDLLYAQPSTITGLASGNPAVPFTFRHLLSKVKFSFFNNYVATGASIRVKNIKINNAYTTGKVELTQDNTTWSTHATQTLELNFGMATDNEATADVKENDEVNYSSGATYESQNELFLIPNATPSYTVGAETKTGYHVTFTVELLVSNQLIATYNHSVPVDFKPIAGYSYDIKAEINPDNINPDPTVEKEPIEFTVTEFTGWTPASGENLPTIN